MSLPPIAAFIDARLADELTALEWTFVRPGDDPTPEFMRRIRGTTRYQHAALTITATRLAVAVAASWPNINGRWLRGHAAKYADHPDFDPAWLVDNKAWGKSWGRSTPFTEPD